MGMNLIALVERIGVSPEDGPDTRLQKSLLVSGSLMFLMAGFLWGLLYIALDEPYPGLIPLLYAMFSAVSVIHFAITLRYQFFRFTQIFLILILPFFLQIALGGFINSSAVVLWALVSPLSALLFGQFGSANRWFAAYAGLVVVSGLIQPYVRLDNNLSDGTIFGFFVMNVVGVSALVFIQFRYFTSLKNRAYAMLDEEQARTEKLLLNVLPKEIAPILKAGQGAPGQTIAEHFDAVTVLFADVVGFTPLSVELAPRAMVELLNEVFSYFDVLVEKYDLEKIRTIGDNYMVVAGAPRRRPDHAQAIARLALGMLGFTEVCENPSARRLQFRIGINSGPAVAGVIGHTKFHYDLWGDAVNTASRMESHGEPGKIQIAPPAWELLKDEFICQPRGMLEIKGKGEMETWFLEGERGVTPPSPHSQTGR